MASRRTSKLQEADFRLCWPWSSAAAPDCGDGSIPTPRSSAAVLQKLRGARPAARRSSPLLSILPQKDSFTTAGTFEVTIAKVSVDPAEFRQGRHVDMQVKVSKKHANGQQQLLWDSRYRRRSPLSRRPRAGHRLVVR